MTTTGQYRFTILDAMILVAAIALGFAYLRWATPAMYDRLQTTVFSDLVGGWVMSACECSAPIAIGLTFGVLLLGIWPGGEPRQPRLGQPGLAACLAAIVRWIIMVIANTFEQIGFLSLRDAFEMDAIIIGDIGAVVAIVWIVLFASGRWQSTSGWRERLGRAMAIYWVAAR